MAQETQSEGSRPLDNQSQGNQPQGNQPQGNQPPQSTQPPGKNRERNQRYRRDKKLRMQQMQQAQRNADQNSQPQNSQPQNSQPQKSKAQKTQTQNTPHQNTQPQKPQPQKTQPQNKAARANQRRKNRPRTKFLQQYPPWYVRAFRWEHERLGTFQEHDPLPEWFFDEDLSDWECDCTKDPPDCRCRQPQVKLRGNFEDNEELSELVETRNKRKRELRIERFEEEKEETEARERTPKVLEREIAKVSQIQAAIREIENSKAPDTKTPINIYHRAYDLYCIELCQLTQRREILDTRIWFNDDWEIRDEENEVEDPRMGVLRDDKPTEHMETELCAFMTFDELDKIEYCSSKPFLNPRYAGRYSVGRWGLRDAPMEITFHNQDYLEIKIHSKAFLKNRG